MSRAGTLILIGILIVLAPVSGLPMSVRMFLSIVFGACVIAIGIIIRSRDAKCAEASPLSMNRASAEPPVPPEISPI